MLSIHCKKITSYNSAFFTKLFYILQYSRNSVKKKIHFAKIIRQKTHCFKKSARADPERVVSYQHVLEDTIDVILNCGVLLV